MTVRDVIRELVGGDEEAAMSDPLDPEPMPDELPAEFGAGDPEEPEAAGVTTDELESRLDDLAADLQDYSTQLGRIEGSQAEVEETLSEVDHTIRTLLGVYDQLTEDVNPFVDDGDDGEFRFGLVDEPDATDEPVVSFDDLLESAEDEDASHASAGDEHSSGGNDDGGGADAGRLGDDTVVDDDDAGAGAEPDGSALADGATQAVQPGAAAHGAAEADAPGGTAGPVDPDPTAGPVDGRAQRQEHAASGLDRARSPEEAIDPDWADPVGDHRIGLERLAETYATDILLFEWLSDLVSIAGPAGALKAVFYYNDIGWIGDEVKSHLEDVLSGPHLDTHVDPTQPNELSERDHARSYVYVRKLAIVGEMSGTEC